VLVAPRSAIYALGQLAGLGISTLPIAAGIVYDAAGLFGRELIPACKLAYIVLRVGRGRSSHFRLDSCYGFLAGPGSPAIIAFGGSWVPRFFADFFCGEFLGFLWGLGRRFPIGFLLITFARRFAFLQCSC
jgi:hypothetical protein